MHLDGLIPLVTNANQSKKILTSQIGPAFTTAPFAVPDHSRSVDERELQRLPKSGEVDPIFSIKRGKWNQLILPCKANNFRASIKSISVRKPGAQRGVRLIVVASARAYFQGLIAEAEAAERERNEAVPVAQQRKPRSASSRK